MDRANAIDGNTIEALRDVMEDEFRGLIENFLQDTPTKLTALHEALEQTNAEALAGIAHSLKGSSSTFGASHFVSLCSELVHKSRSGELDGVFQLVARIEEEFAAVQAALAQKLN